MALTAPIVGAPAAGPIFIIPPQHFIILTSMRPVAGEAHDHVSAKIYDTVWLTGIKTSKTTGPGYRAIRVIDTYAAFCAKGIGIFS